MRELAVVADLVIEMGDGVPNPRLTLLHVAYHPARRLEALAEQVTDLEPAVRTWRTA